MAALMAVAVGGVAIAVVILARLAVAIAFLSRLQTVAVWRDKAGSLDLFVDALL
jgi:hypothetical protein